MTMPTDIPGHDAGYYAYRADERGPSVPSSSAWGTTLGAGLPTVTKPGYAGVSTPKPPINPTVAQAGGGSVYDWIVQTFASYGMGQLGHDALDAIKSARSPEEATTLIQQTDAYKQRFAGNLARQKAGLPALLEGDYLSLESSYRQVMHAAGMPKGFYDQPADFAKFIGQDVSPSEIATRAQTAMTLVNSRDPNELKAFADYYGISKGHLAAYYLDPTKALPILQQQAETASIGAEALRAGIHADESFAAHLQAAGVTKDAARQAYTDTAEQKATIAKLGAIDHQGIGVNDIVDAKLGLNAKADKALQQQSARERSRFSGRSGGTTGLLADGKAGGAF